MRVAVIGGGLAGTACAYVLGQAGATPVIYESGPALAAGASGNDIGLYNPRLSAMRTPESDFYASAFAMALRTFPLLGDIGWNPCGALHLMINEQKQKRFPQAAENWGWPAEDMRIVSASEASGIAAITIEHEALYIAQSGTVSPRKLCAAYAQGSEHRLGVEVENPEELDIDAVILCNGMGVQNFTDLPLQTVRGQITEVAPSETSNLLACAICYGGYVTPAQDGKHIVGSTFQRWLDHTDILEEDDCENLEKMTLAVPALVGLSGITGHRAAVRTTVRDHFPVVGALRENVYVSTAHGSHGILSSLAAAHLLADMILGRPCSQSRATIQKLSPARFTPG